MYFKGHRGSDDGHGLVPHLRVLALLQGRLHAENGADGIVTEEIYAPQTWRSAGSLRTHSFNKKLIAVAAKAVEEACAEVTVADLRDYAMPIFDEDLEASAGMPEAAQRFKVLRSVITPF